MQLLYFLISFFLFETLKEANTSAMNIDDDYLDVVFHFKTDIPWESCNLFLITVVETGDEIKTMLTSNSLLQQQTDVLKELFGDKNIFCLYQLTYQNSITVMGTNNDVLIGYFMYKSKNYYANHIPILHEMNQNVTLTSIKQSIKIPSNFAQSVKLKSLTEMKSQGQMAVEPQVNVNYVNNTMDEYFVELYLVADQAFYLKHGSDSRNYLFQVVNYVNAVYQPQGIHILLVGLEVWSDYNRISITSNSSQVLSNLQAWRASMTQNHDNLQLITGNSFLNSIISSGIRTGMCRWEYSFGITADIVSTSPITTAMLLAGTIGLNMGMNFDLSTCYCPDIQCIMSPSFSFQNKLLPWSDCSLLSLYTNLKSGQSSYCLNNIPSVVLTSTVAQACGNGIIDDGEDCDPGLADTSSQCCDKSTCKFVNNAVCASGRCCNKTTCQFLTAGVICRREKDDCDLAEYCTGCSETCPDDLYSQNGLSCDSGLGTCYDGRCGSHNKQCKMLYGTLSSKADDSCYQMNSIFAALSFGFCKDDFVNLADGFYHYNLSPCSTENILCGTLHCTGGSVAWPTIALLGYNYSFPSGIYSCQHVFISTNLTGLRDPGMVPNGARCGTGKICQNSVCVPLNVTSPVTTLNTPTIQCQNMSKPVLTVPVTSAPISTVPVTIVSTSTTTTPSLTTPSSIVPSIIPYSTMPTTSVTITTTKKPTICPQNYCKNGGTCYTGTSNCNGDSICCLCTTDYLLPFCETRAIRSMAMSMTINEVYSNKHADVTSVEFKSVSNSVCSLLKEASSTIFTSPIICILYQIRKGSIITDVIIKSSSSSIKSITAIGTAMQNVCQNSQQSLCANLNFASLVENTSLYNVCPNGVPTSATTCSTNSYCTGDNTNAALYTCACKTGYRDSYTGINSDYQGRICTEICVDSSCQNGGSCVEHVGNSSTCICPIDSSGNKCESVNTGNTTMIIIIVVIVGVLGIVGGIVTAILCYKKKCSKKGKKNEPIVYDTTDPYYSSYKNTDNPNIYACLDEVNRVTSNGNDYDEVGIKITT